MNIKQQILMLLSILFSLPFCSALTSGEGTIIFGAIFSMSMIVIFFLILSIVIKNNSMKIFFISMAFLTILASVGMGVSVMQEFFSDLTSIVSSYGSFYILLTILTAGGLFALIVWLVIVAFKSFYSYRGLTDDNGD
tara:strand:+ start:9394 stop:9804 length:411 start_codon:yes stop_codon:yes gene_type:complete